MHLVYIYSFTVGTDLYYNVFVELAYHTTQGEFTVLSYKGGTAMKRLLTLVLSLLILMPIEGLSQTTDIVYAVGDNGTILELVGGQWFTVDPGDLTGCGTLLEIWGSSSDDIYITGCIGDLLHYDGIEWHRITIPDTTPSYGDQFETVNGTGPDDVYVGGGEYDGMYFYGRVYHYDGSDWSYIGGNGWTNTLWAEPGGGLYAICTKFDYAQVGDPPYKLVSQYTDDEWATDWVADEEYGEAFHDISGFLAGHPFMSGRIFDFWVGTGGFISRKDIDWNLLWYGIGCDENVYPNSCPIWPIDFFGIWCESDTDVWFAGENGMVMHWTPGGYTEYDTGVTETLRAIWGRSNSDLYAVGDGGRIVHFNGTSWTNMTTPTTQNLKDIWGLSETPIATLLQSFSTDTDAGRVTIRWSLSETDDSVEFRVSRTSPPSAVPIIDEDPSIERDGPSFTYVDTDVEPGEDYTYLVEYSDGDEWIALFQSERIVMPAVSIALMPNYPNPFNPSTRITYSVPEHGHVSLKIYDVSGTLIRTIVDISQAPGTYSVNWNGLNDQGRNAATGAYFCRLVTAKRAVTRKMLLTR